MFSTIHLLLSQNKQKDDSHERKFYEICMINIFL